MDFHFANCKRLPGRVPSMLFTQSPGPQGRRIPFRIKKSPGSGLGGLLGGFLKWVVPQKSSQSSFFVFFHEINHLAITRGYHFFVDKKRLTIGNPTGSLKPSYFFVGCSMKSCWSCWMTWSAEFSPAKMLI